MENYFHKFVEKHHHLNRTKETPIIKSDIFQHFDENEYVAKEHMIDISNSTLDEKYFKFI